MIFYSMILSKISILWKRNSGIRYPVWWIMIWKLYVCYNRRFGLYKPLSNLWFFLASFTEKRQTPINNFAINMILLIMKFILKKISAIHWSFIINSLWLTETILSDFVQKLWGFVFVLAGGVFWKHGLPEVNCEQVGISNPTSICQCDCFWPGDDLIFPVLNIFRKICGFFNNLYC